MSDPLPLVIANHKANLTYSEFEIWVNKVGPVAKDFEGTVVVCPSSPFLAQALILTQAQSWNLKIGAQDISRFDIGAYTGEVAASQLAGICKYAIVGHSERRKNFNETDEILDQKVQMAKKVNLTPIFCVQDENTKIPEGIEVVAYEPVFSIGTGNPDTPQNARAVSAKIQEKGDYIILYGGSVKGDNVKNFVEKSVIDGVLIGSASLDPQDFIEILQSIY
ncbi:triosephosphate isomerase [Candidatus Curtissbacteria bacterium]|nr:triosephosphate isomerase [Candidatus Curtissbacteria bacterium]